MRARSILGGLESPDHSERRNARTAWAAATALVARGISFLVGIATVPLTIGYLGVERYGVWIVVSTILIWLAMVDLGLGNGLINALADAYGRDRRDLAQTLVASTFWALVAISAAVGLVIALCWPLLDWGALFKVTSVEAKAEVGTAVALAFALTLIGVPLGVAAKIWQAYQEGAIANLWSALGSLACLIGIVVVVRGEGGLPALVLAFTGGQVLVSALSLVWLFGSQKPWLRPALTKVELSEGARLLRKGGEFFLLQLAALLLFQSDTLVITRFLGARQVSDYNVPYRLFAYVPMLQALLLTPLWPAYAEAAARDDWAWIRRTFRRTLWIGMSAATAVIVGLAAFARPLIEVWTRGEISASTEVVVLMAAWTWFWCWGNTFALLQNGVGHIRVQWLVGMVMAVMNLTLSIYLVGTMGVAGVLLATVVSYGLLSSWAMPLDAVLLLRRARRREGAGA